MKWIELNGKKEPTPGKSYLTKNKKGGWDKLTLEKIEITSSGKVYLFTDFEGHGFTDNTHYIDVTEQIEKESN